MVDKKLTGADMKSYEEYMAERQEYSDAVARELGYPSAEVGSGERYGGKLK
jgi:hypothetical protein